MTQIHKMSLMFIDSQYKTVWKMLASVLRPKFDLLFFIFLIDVLSYKHLLT